MKRWRYLYTNKEGEQKQQVIEAPSRRQADAKFVAITGVFEADLIEQIDELHEIYSEPWNTARYTPENHALWCRMLVQSKANGLTRSELLLEQLILNYEILCWFDACENL
jgi:type II secretory pathway component PulF